MLRVNSAGQATRDSTNALDDALAALEFQTSSRTVDGGGVAISVGPAIQAFTDNEVIVSFCGHLTNVDYLAWRLFSPEGRRGDSIAQNPLEAASKLIGGRCYEAELICHMYKTFGTKSLPKLRGKFSFSCFDARSVRVFAARDPSGTYPLLYGRDGMGTVVVANFESAKEMLDGGKFQPVPAGCFIYGHRGISPQRYAKDMASSQLQAAAAADAAANALRGLKVHGRKSIDGGERRKSLESNSSRRNSRLQWRQSGEDSGTTPTLNADAKPWSMDVFAEGSEIPGSDNSSSDEREKEPDISAEDGSVLDGLETRAELDTVDESRDELEPGTAEEHRQAETVAVKAAAAALSRIASGANMKGMVRMGSSNTLQALGMGGSATARRTSDSSDTLESEEMAIHRVPSRSGRISSMVKVASFGNLGKIQNVGSLNDLSHAGAPGRARQGSTKNDDTEEEDSQWADMSLLVISNASRDEA